MRHRSPPAPAAPAIHNENGRDTQKVPAAAAKGGAVPTKVSAKATGNEQRAGTWPVAELAFCSVVIASLGYAYWVRREGLLTPAAGIGYYLGIAGSLMMLSLLLYPLRKTWKVLQNAGSVHLWFNVHAAFGILGPALVIAHSNFELNSTNATVAMAIMLLVVASGVIGRYIYSLIHVGMSGKRAQLSELLDDADALRHAFGKDMQLAPEIEAELKAYEEEVLKSRKSALGSFAASLFVSARSRAVQSQIIGKEYQTEFLVLAGVRYDLSSAR